MPFWSKLRRKRDIDLAESRSTAVTAAQNDNSGAKREDFGLFIITNPKENDHSVELGEAPHHHGRKVLTNIVLLRFMDFGETGKGRGPMIMEPYGSGISCHHSYPQQGSCPTATTLGSLSANLFRT